MRVVSYYKSMENVRLTNGVETFTLGSILEDEKGPVHGKDSRGSGYTRCDIGCDHEALRTMTTSKTRSYHLMPDEPKVWHDDQHTETLWEVK